MVLRQNINNPLPFPSNRQEIVSFTLPLRQVGTTWHCAAQSSDRGINLLISVNLDCD